MDREMKSNKAKAARRRYHERIDHYREYGRLSYHRNRARRIASAKVYRQRVADLLRLKSYKSLARSRNLEWSLSDGLALDLMSDSCYYCGTTPEPLNGIDRVNNLLGYSEDNVVTACSMCNIGKNKHTKDTFEAWISRAAMHQARWRNITT